ncbi:MAG: hypothetical protein HDR81_00150 [Bacteroides sp.]|nr:hypothetical protein [Bacteroides sp.]
MNLYVRVYSELIQIGRDLSLEKCLEVQKFFPAGSSEAWLLYNQSLTEQYSYEDLINLFRGLVICEKELQWHCGSTTPASHLYQDIKNLGLDIDDSLADWAFRYSDNEYVPLGFIRHGEESAYEYLQWREDYLSRINLEQEEKKTRKNLQLERAKKISEEKKKRDEAIRAFHSHIIQLPIKEQIDTIIADDKHTLYFYIPVIYALLNRKDVTIDDLEKLVHRIEDMKSTPFRKKVIQLILKKMSSLM